MSTDVPAQTSADGVRRFTTEYIVAEDRIRLAVERQDDAVQHLWLTRRLMLRMVPELVKYLTEVAPTAPEMAKQGPNTSGLSDNAQRLQQMEALGQIAQQPPVRASEEAEAADNLLIASLRVQMGRNGIRVSFLVADGTVVLQMPFVHDALRQWLGILHMSFRKAQWADDVWPAWITAKGWDQGPDALRLN